MSIVSFRGVSRAFGKSWALRGVDLEIEEGTAFGLVGRNGAGKTTLLRMIPALLHATEGEVRVFGMDPWDHQDEVKAQIGYLSESDDYPPRVKARDLLDLCADIYPRWDAAMAARLLEAFELDPGERMGALSTGQQRQVGLICALCHRPRLLVLDEPGGSLDPVVRREFLEMVVDLLLKAGSTVIFSSHQFADLERIASRVAILHRGEIIADRALDAYRRDCCRILVCGPASETMTNEVKDERLPSLPGCVRVRRRADGIALTFIVNEAAARERLVARFGPGIEMEARAIGLEELFIDWTRGKALTPASGIEEVKPGRAEEG
jgi:ABC-type multidrug transport system ATPase subunit